MSESPKTRVATRMAERRARILESARRIIAERGFEGLTVRELAEAAGVTVPTIYNLVGSKEQVLIAAVTEQTERFLRGIERASGDVVPIVEANLRELLRMPRYYRSLLRVLLVSEDGAAARRTVSLALGGQLRAALGELAEEGAVEEWVDLDALTREIQRLLGGAAQEWSAGVLSDDELARSERYGVALLMLGVTRGATREAYLRLARANQIGSRKGRSASVTRLRARR